MQFLSVTRDNNLARWRSFSVSITGHPAGLLPRPTHRRLFSAQRTTDVMHEEVKTNGPQPRSLGPFLPHAILFYPALVQLNMGRKFWKTSAAVVDRAEEKQKSAFFKDVPTTWRRSTKKSCALGAGTIFRASRQVTSLRKAQYIFLASLSAAGTHMEENRAVKKQAPKLRKKYFDSCSRVVQIGRLHRAGFPLTVLFSFPTFFLFRSQLFFGWSVRPGPTLFLIDRRPRSSPDFFTGSWLGFFW